MVQMKSVEKTLFKQTTILLVSLSIGILTFFSRSKALILFLKEKKSFLAEIYFPKIDGLTHFFIIWNWWWFSEALKFLPEDLPKGIWVAGHYMLIPCDSFLKLLESSLGMLTFTQVLILYFKRI